MAFDFGSAAKQKRFQPIQEVVIDGLAVLKIVKHCNDNYPSMVAGSLLGIDIEDQLEVTYVYPFPAPQSKADLDADTVEEMDGGEYQFEMMKMLQKVNIDNNCVGWYTSVYFGSMFTMDVVNIQFSHQSSEELTENCVVIMFDPVQTKKGSLVLKAYRLSDKFIAMRKSKLNYFIKPSQILVEVPLKIKNSGYVTAFLDSLKTNYSEQLNCDFDLLSLTGAEAYAEKSLELMGTVVDDLLHEQQKFQQYSKLSAKGRQEYTRAYNKRVAENQERKENGERVLSLDIRDLGLKPLPEAPPRGEQLLSLGQLSIYCKQMNEYTASNLNKLILTSQLNNATTLPQSTNENENHVEIDNKLKTPVKQGRESLGSVGYTPLSAQDTWRNVDEDD